MTRARRRSTCSATRIIAEIAKLLTARRSASSVRRTAPQCGVSAQNHSSWANSVVAAAETSREDYGKNCSRSLFYTCCGPRERGRSKRSESSERRRNESSFDFSGKILALRACFLFLLSVTDHSCFLRPFLHSFLIVVVLKCSSYYSTYYQGSR